MRQDDPASRRCLSRAPFGGAPRRRKMDTMITVWKDGTYKYQDSLSAEYAANDPNWLANIPAPHVDLLETQRQQYADKCLELIAVNKFHAAEHSVHQTGLTPRQKEEVEQIIMRAIMPGSV